MKRLRVKNNNDQSSEKGHGLRERYQRCELCNVPIFRNPCSDERSNSVFKGKGKRLCNKCAEALAQMPEEQALQALENASKTYREK